MREVMPETSLKNESETQGAIDKSSASLQATVSAHFGTRFTCHFWDPSNLPFFFLSTFLCPILVRIGWPSQLKRAIGSY